MDLPIIETMLIILLTALFVSFVFRALRLPVILGYLFVGAIIGPHNLGWLPDLADIKELAELGVALLMFTIGLEFSLSKIIALRFAVFVLGGLQVIACILATMLMSLMLDMSLIEAIVIGSIVAMSSTAIVVKQLSQQFEIQTPHGLNAIGILLFQDLAVVPILVLLASLSSSGTNSFISILGIALLKGALAFVIIISVGRWLLRPLFHKIAATRVVELFSLTVIFVALGAAWLTYTLGLSYALGAFLAGIMLGETEFRHQIEVEIRPFRDVLLALFFVSVGMLVNITAWFDTWIWIALLLVALIIGKAVLIVFLSRITKYPMATALRTGIVLSQGGEFGFAILTLALANKLLPADYGQVVLAALLISYGAAPLIIRHHLAILKLIFPKMMQQQEKIGEISELTSKLSDHIIICGYGRVGQNISRFLNKLEYPYIGIDLDPEIIHNAQLVGDTVAFGNATHLQILKAAKLTHAAAIVITINNVHASLAIIEQIRRIEPEMPILVRCRDDVDFDELQQSGATKIITETFEESLSLVSHLLRQIHIPQQQISKLLQETRDKNYALLSHVFPGTSLNHDDEDEFLHEYLRPIPLLPQSYAVNRKVSELNLAEVEIIAIRRGKKQLQPKSKIRLAAGDIVILFGSPMHLDDAENILLGE